KLLRDYRVDFIILNLKSDQVTIQDLQARGYSPVWVDENYSGLFTTRKHLAQLRQTAAELPPTTIEPLDPNIPKGFWRLDPGKDQTVAVKN
ncbi:MAG: hypothetical protein ABIR24_03010, partial [Verrucomicrobiota bacterium]